MTTTDAVLPEGSITAVPGHPDLYEVQGSIPEPYYVNAESGYCTCKSYQYRHAEAGTLCKHGIAVRAHVEQQDACPYCTKGFVLLQTRYLGPDATPESPLMRCSICGGTGQREPSSLPSQDELRKLFA